jgi:hypothetical protein
MKFSSQSAFTALNLPLGLILLSGNKGGYKKQETIYPKCEYRAGNLVSAFCDHYAVGFTLSSIIIQITLNCSKITFP